MFFKKKQKIDSQEYLELLGAIETLKIQLKTLELDLQLYVKKLRATKGLSKKEQEKETENYNNTQILPM